MIKLSEVKVRAQYRTRVRYRLVVLEYAGERGAAAAGRHYGISARKVRRWRKRWRRDGMEGLVPAYPRHRPRRPHQNGKVERSHRINQEEFSGRQRFQEFEAAAAALRDRETRYNYERFSPALQGRIPAEKLAALHPPQRAASTPHD